jgi:acyl-CoA dehydrogenase
MDFEFSSDALMLRDMLRRFVQKEARPLEMKFFNSGSLTLEERAHLRSGIEQLGLWNVTVPEKFGGGGLDALTMCLIEEELGRTFVPMEIGDVPPMLYACSGDQVTRFLEPALSGERRAIVAAREPSNHLRPESWTTAASANGDGFLINGFKTLSTMPDEKDFLIVFAKGAVGLTAFLLDANAQGLNASANGEIVLRLRECRVGRDSILGEEGKALTLGSAAAPCMWIRMGARYVGIVERLIEMATDHARDWESLGAPLAARPAIQSMLAEMRVDVESARWLVYHAAWQADRGEALQHVAAQVRLATGEMLQRAVDRVTMIYTGPSPQMDVRRIVRSVVPPETLELALEYARGAIAAEMVSAKSAA